MNPENSKIISPDAPPELVERMNVYKIHTSDGVWSIRAANAAQALDLCEDKIAHILHTDCRTVTIFNQPIEVVITDKTVNGALHKFVDSLFNDVKPIQ